MTTRAAVRCGIGGVAALALLIAVGCATQALESARRDFYRGHFAEAERKLNRNFPAHDRVMYLMERGTIRMFSGEYKLALKDYIAAYDRLVDLETWSVTRGGASLVVNDTVQDFRGFPYERTLLHAFAAKCHFALGDWELAAVEARRIIQSLDPDVLRGYPEDAYSRYVAGAALELAGDQSNARVQYRKAAELAPSAMIDPESGRLGGLSSEPPTGTELLVFVMMGRAPRIDTASLPVLDLYAEIYANDKRLGRSYLLTDTGQLAAKSFEKDAARQIAKTATRLVAKEAIAQQLDKQDPVLGDLTRLILIGLLEKPDTRRWETLPRHLHVARVPCPPDLKSYTILFKTSSGVTVARREVAAPIQRNGSVFVSFARDIGGLPGG